MTLKEEHMEEGQPAAEAAATAAPAAGAAANQPPPPEYCEVAVAAAASTTTAAMAATTATTVEAALSPPHEPPPAYQVAAALPSYEEAERTKGKSAAKELASTTDDVVANVRADVVPSIIGQSRTPKERGRKSLPQCGAQVSNHSLVPNDNSTKSHSNTRVIRLLPNAIMLCNLSQSTVCPQGVIVHS